MKKALLILVIFSICISCKKDDPTVPKSDKYESVTIGTQVWMLKNLNVDHYRNGDPIPEVKDSLEWVSLKTGAWCYYNNDPAMGAIYGKLYNWNAVNDPRGLAPKGWHIPSDGEWITLFTFFGGDSVGGGKLKENFRNHWINPNIGASKESAFSALLSGCRGYGSLGIFNEIGNYGYWWLSYDKGGPSFAFVSGQDYGRRWMGRSNYYKVFGFSVRCVRDSI